MEKVSSDISTPRSAVIFVCNIAQLSVTIHYRTPWSLLDVCGAALYQKTRLVSKGGSVDPRDLVSLCEAAA